MAYVVEVRKTCPHCHGSGETPDYPDSGGSPPSGTETCTECNGNTTVLVFSVDLGDMDDKLDDIMDKCNDIFEEVSS